MARGTAWLEEEQRQGPEEAAVASRPSVSKHARQLSQGSDFDHGADDVAQFEHDEATTDMDMEMREC